MRQLVYLASSDDDLANILRSIARDSGSVTVARAFIAKLTGRCRHIAALPGDLGSPRPELGPGIRSVPHQSYVIYFRYSGTRMEIVNILHGARDVDAYYGDTGGPTQNPQ